MNCWACAPRVKIPAHFIHTHKNTGHKTNLCSMHALMWLGSGMVVAVSPTETNGVPGDENAIVQSEAARGIEQLEEMLRGQTNGQET